MKKTLALLLAFVMCFLMFNVTGGITASAATKTVKNIVPTRVLYSLDSSCPVSLISGYLFEYKVTYTDNTYTTMQYAGLVANGYTPPTILYVGDTITVHGDAHIAAGEQPIRSVYDGFPSIMYVEVDSLIDFVSSLGAVKENDHCLIEYENDEEQTYWWHVNVDASGLYGIWRYNDDDFNVNFDSFSVEIFDENDNLVEFDNEKLAWTLYAGKDYALSFQYTYNTAYSANDVEFWLQKQADLARNGWVKDNGKWYFYENGVMIKNAWRKDSKGWVRLGADGAMETNKWVKDSKGWCYVGADGYAVTNCWKKDSHGWIYLDANGSMTKSKWVKSSGKWYYLDAEGYMLTNKWQKDSKGWVYVGDDGAMVINKWVKDSKGWCYVGADGYAVTNCWKKDSHGWIYLDANGSMTKSKWVKDNGKWYYCNASGYMVANTSVKIGNKTYNFNASGVCTNP